MEKMCERPSGLSGARRSDWKTRVPIKPDGKGLADAGTDGARAPAPKKNSRAKSERATHYRRFKRFKVQGFNGFTWVHLG